MVVELFCLFFLILRTKGGLANMRLYYMIFLGRRAHISVVKGLDLVFAQI